jgi:anti-sigma factor RsiW
VISTMRTMLSCHFTARRIQRYLDADPAAPLDPTEVRRLEGHLAECARCSAAVEDFRALRWAMLRLSRLVGPDPRAVDRMHQVVDRLVEQQGA